MAPVFSPDIIARVKDETDIVEIVRRQVDLKPSGSVLKGLCPFHKEKTPSFIVTPARQRYHCFGCGTGGDVITFVMETEGVTFPEAVEILARPLDIDLSAWLREDEGEGERRAFHRANEEAAAIFAGALWDDRAGRGARAYLERRGFGEKVLRDFDVGWAPANAQWLEERLAGAGVDRELALASGLVRQGDHGTFAYFRGRIIFPIRSISRQVAGFGGRVVDQGEPKYLNSSDSTYFSKGRLLYGFDASRMAVAREKTAILVEGYLDLLALAQAGFAHVVATCGTAFTPEQAGLIRRGAPRVLLVFDGDKAGLKAAVRAADVALRHGLEPRIVRLPPGEDPASLLENRGTAAMAEVLATGEGYVPLLRALADERGGGREVSERALRQALATAGGIADPLRRAYVLQEAAEVFGMAPDVLRAATPRPAAPSRGADPVQPEPARNVLEEDRPAPAPRAPRRTRVRKLHLSDPRRIERDLLGAVLDDDSGAAARLLLAERGDLAFVVEHAETLAGELDAWAEGGDGTPRDFVLQRWNVAGDGAYRDWISGLIDGEERDRNADKTRVIRDCLEKLRQDAGRRGHP